MAGLDAHRIIDLCHFVFRETCRDEGCPKPSGRNGVHPDALIDKTVCQGTGKTNVGPFSRRIIY